MSYGSLLPRPNAPPLSATELREMDERAAEWEAKHPPEEWPAFYLDAAGFRRMKVQRRLLLGMADLLNCTTPGLEEARKQLMDALVARLLPDMVEVVTAILELPKS